MLAFLCRGFRFSTVSTLKSDDTAALKAAKGNSEKPRNKAKREANCGHSHWKTWKSIAASAKKKSQAESFAFSGRVSSCNEPGNAKPPIMYLLAIVVTVSLLCWPAIYNPVRDCWTSSSVESRRFPLSLSVVHFNRWKTFTVDIYAKDFPFYYLRLVLRYRKVLNVNEQLSRGARFFMHSAWRVSMFRSVLIVGCKTKKHR